MNFLAHLHLAEATPESRLGNILGDFVKGLPWDDRHSEAVWQGIMEHRFLDAFTDSHEAWKMSRGRLREENRRYAGIIIDVFYDFFLHRHWPKFSPDIGLEDFIEDVHRDLASVIDQAPKDAAAVIGRMISEQWLLSYGQIEGVADALARVAASSPNLAKVRGMERELEANLEGFEVDFLRFYPAAMKRVVIIRTEAVPKRKIFVTKNLSPDIR
ncbi:MAG: ACP phosphodiesterase [Verrucomicrobiales bacterium]|nr:ACP phosphodiesterase [Verrucomicrobiales bacterium]